MSNFIVNSIIVSVVLTIVINVLPAIFPNGAAKMQRKLEENARKAIAQHEDDERPRVKVFFPWKAMVLLSILMTILVNAASFMSRNTSL